MILINRKNNELLLATPLLLHIHPLTKDLISIHSLSPKKKINNLRDVEIADV